MFSDKDRRSLKSNPLVQSGGPNQVQFTVKFKLGVDPNLEAENDFLKKLRALAEELENKKFTR
jgi:hypothetical protein